VLVILTHSRESLLSGRGLGTNWTILLFEGLCKSLDMRGIGTAFGLEIYAYCPLAPLNLMCLFAPSLLLWNVACGILLRRLRRQYLM
jgi:hypothetical protein